MKIYDILLSTISLLLSLSMLIYVVFFKLRVDEYREKEYTHYLLVSEVTGGFTGLITNVEIDPEHFYNSQHKEFSLKEFSLKVFSVETNVVITSKELMSMNVNELHWVLKGIIK